MKNKKFKTFFLFCFSFQHYPTKTPPQKQSQATTPSSYRTELSGSYASLDCPSPPGPPILSDKGRDPQTRLAIYLKTLYIDLSLKEPILPSWVHPVIPGTLCPARLEPELRLSSLSHGLNECISIDQVLTAVHVSFLSFFLLARFLIKFSIFSQNRPKMDHFWRRHVEYLLNVLHGW